MNTLIHALKRNFIFRFIYSIFFRKSPYPIPGIPETMDRDLLEKLYLSINNNQVYLAIDNNYPNKHYSHIQLSSWKPSGTYRIIAHSTNGSNWSLVYKNSSYDLKEIPALEGLPIRPGHSEYVIYCHPKDLDEYLPFAYLHREIIPKTRYEYLLQDLSYDYKRILHNDNLLKTILKVVEELPFFYSSMDEWADVVGQEHLQSYNEYFSLELQKYAKKNFERYFHFTLDKRVAEVLKKWSDICKIHRCQELHRLKRLPIHGDLNTSNIWIHKEKNKIKIVDWEWAGFGLRHADLASLLKATPPKIENIALKTYIEQNSDFSPIEHKQIYNWCKLERGLLDGSFIAAQYVGAPRVMTEMNMVAFVKDAMYRTLVAYNELSRSL
jgi:serine/threonine protein kinase